MDCSPSFSHCICFEYCLLGFQQGWAVSDASCSPNTPSLSIPAGRPGSAGTGGRRSTPQEAAAAAQEACATPMQNHLAGEAEAGTKRAPSALSGLFSAAIRDVSAALQCNLHSSFQSRLQHKKSSPCATYNTSMLQEVKRKLDATLLCGVNRQRAACSQHAEVSNQMGA